MKMCKLHHFNQLSLFGYLDHLKTKSLPYTTVMVKKGFCCVQSSKGSNKKTQKMIVTVAC